MKKTIKKIVSLTLCMILTFTAVSFAVANGASAPSLNESAVYIDGYDVNGKFVFKPEDTMKRSEAIKIVAVIAGWKKSFDAESIDSDFTDLNEAEWYATYVKYLEKYGMLDFLGKTLSADKGITRAEFVKLISPYVPKMSGTKSFPDVPSSHPYYDAIIAAAKAGIVEGNPDGTFNPGGTLKRSEIVTIIDRLLGRNIVESNTKKIQKFDDISGHWSEGYVIAASCTATYEGKVLWYTGNAYSANSPVDKTKLDYSLTESILKGIDVNDGAAVERAVEAAKQRRISEIRSTATTVKPASGKTAYYVSNSGSDSNDGTSPETAWATLSKVSEASLKNGDVVYFKRGDTFRGQLLTKYGVSYSAYGEGEKPRLYGSERDYADEEFWEKTSKRNVYVSKEAFEEDVGVIVFNNGESWTTKKTAGINGTSLVKDLDMYHNTTDNKLYLYSISDPNTRFESVEICDYPTVITGNGHGVTIDNLCLMYSGTSGVDYSSGQPSNLLVQNCEIGWCGGSLMKGRTNDPVRLGNGVGTYGAAKNQVVDNCYIYQIYDAGVTYQWFSSVTSMTVNMIDIKYTDNVIDCATYAIEYINSQPEGFGIMRNIEFSGNFLVNSGSGWGAQRPDRGGSTTSVIKGWGGTNPSDNFLIYDNVIMTKDSYEYTTLVQMCVDDAKNMPEVTGNIFANVKGQNFGLYGTGSHTRERDMIKFDEKILDKTIGLDDNTFVFLEK